MPVNSSSTPESPGRSNPPTAEHGSRSPHGRLLDPDRGFDGDSSGLGERVRALLLGGALGDAIAFQETTEASRLRASAGGRAGDDETAQPPRDLQVSAVTQLNLYTLDGLLEAVEWANAGQPADETACLWLAYLRWLRTQGTGFPETAPSPLPRWIDAFEGLHARRSPDRTALAVLGSGAMGEVERPLLADAMDAGTIMRAAPFGLLPVGWKSIVTMTINASAITHGHPEAQVAAVGYALTVQATVNASRSEIPAPIAAGAAAALEVLPRLTRPGERSIALLSAALDLGRRPMSEDGVPDGLGDGSTAPSALARGVWAAVAAERQSLTAHPAGQPQGTDSASPEPGAEEDGAPGSRDQLMRAVSLSIAGRTETEYAGAASPAGAVAGALTGAGLGTAAIPESLVRRLDVLPVIEEAGRRWCGELGWTSSATA